jgi:hypothetical protein
MNLDDIDPTFPADLIESQAWVRRAARWFGSKRGVYAVVPPLRLRPTPEEKDAYADGGDVHIVERFSVVEIKHRSFAFTCARDFPFKTLFVDPVPLWDKKNPKPQGYMNFNLAGTHVGIILCDATRSKWVLDTQLDRRINRVRTYWTCPKELVLFQRYDG